MKLEIHITGQPHTGKRLACLAVIDALQPRIGSSFSILHYRNGEFFRQTGVQDNSAKLKIHVDEIRAEIVQVDARIKPHD